MDPGSQPLARGLGDCPGGRLMRYLRHPFHGTVVGYLALFVALSGTAWAVAANSVGTQQLKNNAVATSKISDGAVTKPKLANNAVTGAKLARGAVTGAKVARNSLTGAQINESSLDFSVLQRRVTGTCSTGQALASIDQTGGVGCAATGGPPSGSAGGALAGTYPNPSLNVSGGPCANGQALTNVSTLAALTCKPGVYSDANQNVAAGPSPFGSLIGGVFNSALGGDALKADASGSDNTAVGYRAL